MQQREGYRLHRLAGVNAILGPQLLGCSVKQPTTALAALVWYG